MEYYLYITENCNLECTFCCNKQKREGNSNSKSPAEIASFIKQDMKKSGHEKNNVVFYGGEPLLNQKFMKELIQETKNSGLSYVSFTNGTLLGSMDEFLLNNLDALLVSIDGEERIHDKCRGKGTQKKIIENLFKTRSRFNGKTIARMCFTPDSSIYSSVLSVINWFDNVYWQIENSSIKIINEKECLENYSEALGQLIGFWMNHLREGIMKNIIPFQAVTSSILFNRKHSGFRCGAGSNLIAVDINGNCSVCDDLIKEEKFCVGNIFEGINHKKMNETVKNTFCGECEIKNICGGRCFRQWVNFPEKSSFYCNATKLLVNKLNEKIPEINGLIEKGIISKKEFDNPAIQFTEGIP
ncbi:MAG: radical SAM protein [Candidatus Diapherotrites archaeon]